MNKKLFATTLFLGLVLGVVAERVFSLTKLVHHDPYIVIPDRVSIHYCTCVEENPARYNMLLDGAERINADLSEETDRFLRIHGLRSSDLTAVIQVNRNGNTTTRVWCSNRTPKVTGLAAEYLVLVEKYNAQYGALLSGLHSEYAASE